MKNRLNRRTFLKTQLTGMAGLTALASLPNPVQATEKGKVKIGIIGMGGRGSSLMSNFFHMQDRVDIRAVCDLYPDRAKAAQARVVKAGMTQPEAYWGDEQIWEKLTDREDLDAVIIATYWQWHTPMAVRAMKAGKVAGVEVPAALSLDECWELVKTSEATGVPCMMLENWSFRRDNLAVLNMIRQGLLGEIVHCHCAHSHDCIDHWFFDRQTGKDRWPAEFLLKYNRDQYPTHSVGPVYSWMDIGCGDMLESLTSTATGSFGIKDMFIRRFGPDHPGAKRDYAQGDIVTTTIQTKQGKSIVVNYDMQLPRPYDNRWMIQGTRGIYSESRDAVYLLGKSPEYHQWEPFGPYQTQYEHTWWKQGFQGGHGGTDFLELKLFVDAVQQKTQTPLDVYDAVLMSCLVPLSGQSIAAKGAPVKVPDFTGGRWKTRQPTFAM